MVDVLFPQTRKSPPALTETKWRDESNDFIFSIARSTAYPLAIPPKSMVHGPDFRRRCPLISKGADECFCTVDRSSWRGEYPDGSKPQSARKAPQRTSNKP